MHNLNLPLHIKIKQWFQKNLRWMVPGIGVKRWLVLVLVGTIFIGFGITLLAIDGYRNIPDAWWLPVLEKISLLQYERPMRVVIFGVVGVLLLGIGIWGLNRSLLRPYIRPGSRPMLDMVTNYRKRERGPKVVAIGGGNGLASLLRGIKNYTSNITAIVTVADDGGSSGELRKTMGVLPPGDIRNCLAALSDDEELTTQLFKYRFGESAGLGGHSLGNLLITALADITGSFEAGVAESGRVLAVRGRVLPATLSDVRLVADVQTPARNQEIRVRGESNIPTVPGRVKRVSLEPNNPQAYPLTIQAILSADLILVGPGSLYTSVVPNLLVPDLADALRASRGLKFYICNVATQPGETDGYNCKDHVRTIEKHMGGRVFDLIVCNNRQSVDLPQAVELVSLSPDLEEEYAVYSTDLVDEQQPWRHDPMKLARALTDLYYERTGPVLNREDVV